MGGTELRDGVVAVFGEYPVVEILGAVNSDAGSLRGRPRGVLRREELVEQEAAERLGAPAVAREERALHNVREIPEDEHRTFDVRDVGSDSLAFVGGEVIGDHDPIVLVEPVVG